MNAYYVCPNCGPRIFNPQTNNICKTCGSTMEWENDEWNVNEEKPSPEDDGDDETVH